MEKKEICIIRAKLKEDYIWDAIKSYGFDIHIPYKDRNIFLRILREIWYRLGLPKRSIWFNKELKNIEAEIIIVYDSLAVPDLLAWLRNRYKNSRIILNYENRTDTSISPNDVDDSIEKWSYDLSDCARFNMKAIQPSFFNIYAFDADKESKIWDILFVGRDKGRLNEILLLQKKFSKRGLSTNFHICANRSFLRFQKKIYKSFLSYKEYLVILAQSRAILNVSRKDQDAITQRELEALFFNIKCITTNRKVKEYDFYDKNRFFVLGEDKDEDLNSFMSRELLPVEEVIIKKYSFEDVLMKSLQ